MPLWQISRIFQKFPYRFPHLDLPDLNPGNEVADAGNSQARAVGEVGTAQLNFKKLYIEISCCTF